MSANTGGIQPVASLPWVAPETQSQEVPSIPPVTQAEGGATAKVGDFRADSGANFAGLPPELSAEVVQQAQSFCEEFLGIELNFITDADGRTAMLVLDGATGKVIRRIPPEKVSLLRHKIKKFRGFLFDGKA